MPTLLNTFSSVTDAPDGQKKLACWSSDKLLQPSLIFAGKDMGQPGGSTKANNRKYDLSLYLIDLIIIKGKSTPSSCRQVAALDRFYNVYTVKSHRAEQGALKDVNNCLKTNIYFYFETSGRQSSNLYLNIVHFFNINVD